MKYLFQPLAIVSCAFLVNCSSIPEIEPYQKKKELTIEDVREASGFYKDNEFDEEAPTPIADADDTPSVPDKADESFDEPVAKSEPMEKMESIVDEAPVLKEKVASIKKPKAVKEPKSPKTARKQASSFKSGMHAFVQTCSMKTKPSADSEDAGSVQSGKKLWLDSHNGEWHKAYKKSGTVYVPADCVK